MAVPPASGPPTTDRNDINDDVLAGGGEMGALMRSMDWSQTALGPVSEWPQSLRTTVSTCLNSRFPILVWWGPDMVKLYNDAYRPMIANKHPRAMGQNGRDTWPEIWHIIGPMLEGVLHRGEATWSENIMLPLERKGFAEECYFTFSYSPIRDESGGVGGIFSALTETTERVIGERRLRTLRDLAAASSDSGTVEDACRASIEMLERNTADVPFSLLYLLEGANAEARLVASSGIDNDQVKTASASIHAHAQWPLAEVAESYAGRVVDGLGARLGRVPHGPWPEAPASAMVLPLVSQSYDRTIGVLILGISARRPFDEPYQDFFSLVGSQIATSIAKAGAFEAERRRAEALAEIDRAKTHFFSNVSHEFRTPLTLLLGPTEDLLSRTHGDLTPAQHDQLTLVRRNALRLNKLVNTLLDFSRLEAGRMQANYAAADLSQLTSDLASAFRSAVERAGLSYTVDCPPLSEPIFIDRDMWEKVVLNLLSNALKFTFDGGIAVTLRDEGSHVVLRVSDTGVGIAEAERPRLFERFHRVQGARSRTHEGSGIGLALVQELVKLHAGSTTVESTVDAGTTFTISIPKGFDHLPKDRLAAGQSRLSTALGVAPFLEEALRWSDDPDAPAATDADSVARSAERILLADDNADMRDYLCRILEERWTVDCVANGEEALKAAIAYPPDVIVSDVMMPGLDGFALIGELRRHAATQAIPVILVSARAGEESRLEGLNAGAEDYLTKPFSARELVARVDTQLKHVRARAGSA
jgi:signal transduction histidine kinase/CheY-like chemotaxis protein